MPQFCFHLNETTIFLSPLLSQIFVDTSESICIVLQHIWETGVRPYLLLLLFYKSCCTGHFRNLQIVVPLPFLLCHVLKLKCHLQKEATIELCTLWSFWFAWIYKNCQCSTFNCIWHCLAFSPIVQNYKRVENWNYKQSTAAHFTSTRNKISNNHKNSYLFFVFFFYGSSPQYIGGKYGGCINHIIILKYPLHTLWEVKSWF